MKRYVVRSSLVLVAALVSAAAFFPTAAEAKSFTIDHVAIGGQVSSSGNLTIVEERTVTFDGDFSRVFWTLEKRDSGGIEILSVTDDTGAAYTRTEDPASLESRPENTYYVEDAGPRVTVNVYHRSADQTRTFVVQYRALGAAKRWADTGELYWKLLGDDTAVKTKLFTAAIGVEGATSKEEVKAWAHGPLTGEIAISDTGEVSLKVTDVPPNTFAEVRMIFPARLLADAPVLDTKRRDAILAEEGRAADKANRERRGARIAVALWTGLPSLAALVALAVGVVSFIRHGKEYRAEFAGQYFREDPGPDLHPGVVSALWNFGKVENTAIAATLMDLADKGVIVMTPQMVKKPGLGGVFGGTEQSFLLQRAAGKTPASALDRELLALLFDKVAAGRQQFELGEIETYAKANAESFTSEVNAWKDLVKAEAEQHGFFEGESWSWQIGVFVVAAFVAVIAWFGVAQTGSPWPVCIPVPTVIALVVMGWFMRRRSKQGNELFRRYEALRNYLKDFSRLEEAPPASVVLWNRFLVLAVVFGVADQVIEQLRIKLPEVVKDPSFQTSYWWVYSGAHGVTPVSAVSSSFVSAASVARSEMSSSSGGGGGFSGGGGGGGGGGGFGAD